MNEQGLTRQKIFSELVRSPHGKLEDYLPVGRSAIRDDPEFFSHLISWNLHKGQIKDSKVALPLIAVDHMVAVNGDVILRENAVAAFCSLPLREVSRGLAFASESRLRGRPNTLKKAVGLFLDSLERNRAKFDRTVVRHRSTVRELYIFAHKKPSEYARGVLFEGTLPPGSIFNAVANLKRMTPQEAAGNITSMRIPFLTAAPAMDKKAREDSAVRLALLSSMTPNEISSHMKMIARLGSKTDPAVRAALDRGLDRVAGSRSNALKLSKAAEAVDDDELREKIVRVQEKKLDKSSIHGDWLVLVDKSGSMKTSVELGKQVSAVLARLASGQVNLTFFDVGATNYNVTGKTLEEIQQITRHITANGGTSIGVGLRSAMSKDLPIDGIAIISDGGERSAPTFSQVYGELCKKLDKEVPIYFYKVEGDSDFFSDSLKAKYEVQTFDIHSDTDYYSIPNLVQSMRTNRYSLVDEIMDTPLLTLEGVLKLGRPVNA